MVLWAFSTYIVMWLFRGYGRSCWFHLQGAWTWFKRTLKYIVINWSGSINNFFCLIYNDLKHDITNALHTNLMKKSPSSRKLIVVYPIKQSCVGLKVCQLFLQELINGFCDDQRESSSQIHILLSKTYFNSLNAELNPVCYLLALLGAHHFLHVSRIRVKSLTLRLLMSYIYIYIYIYGTPILDVSRSHTTTHHSR